MPDGRLTVIDAAELRRDAFDRLRRCLDDGRDVLVLDRDAPAPAPTRIGVAYCGRARSAAALSAGRRLAADLVPGAAVELVYVDEHEDERTFSRRTAIIEWWLRDLVGSGQDLHAVRRTGDPATELARHSEQVDLLVIGTRPRRRLGRALFGSVALELVATARCPVLVVPSSPRARWRRRTTKAPEDRGFQ